MRTLAILVVATMALGATACGGRTSPAFTPDSPALTGASITFFTGDDGKDTNSTVTAVAGDRAVVLDGADAVTA